MGMRKSGYGFGFGLTFDLLSKTQGMEKRILGIILSLLGVAGILYAAFAFINGGTSTTNIKLIIAFGTVGAIFFFAGIGLVRNTRDKPT
jgi:uncharacterized membrane protein